MSAGVLTCKCKNISAHCSLGSIGDSTVQQRTAVCAGSLTKSARLTLAGVSIVQASLIGCVNNDSGWKLWRCFICSKDCYATYKDEIIFDPNVLKVETSSTTSQSPSSHGNQDDVLGLTAAVRVLFNKSSALLQQPDVPSPVFGIRLQLQEKSGDSSSAANDEDQGAYFDANQLMEAPDEPSHLKVFNRITDQVNKAVYNYEESMNRRIAFYVEEEQRLLREFTTRAYQDKKVYWQRYCQGLQTAVDDSKPSGAVTPRLPSRSKTAVASAGGKEPGSSAISPGLQSDQKQLLAASDSNNTTFEGGPDVVRTVAELTQNKLMATSAELDSKPSLHTNASSSSAGPETVAESRVRKASKSGQQRRVLQHSLSSDVLFPLDVDDSTASGTGTSVPQPGSKQTGSGSGYDIGSGNEELHVTEVDDDDEIADSETETGTDSEPLVHRTAAIRLHQSEWHGAGDDTDSAGTSSTASSAFDINLSTSLPISIPQFTFATGGAGSRSSFTATAVSSSTARPVAAAVAAAVSARESWRNDDSSPSANQFFPPHTYVANRRSAWGGRGDRDRAATLTGVYVRAADFFGQQPSSVRTAATEIVGPQAPVDGPVLINSPQPSGSSSSSKSLTNSGASGLADRLSSTGGNDISPVEDASALLLNDNSAARLAVVSDADVDDSLSELPERPSFRDRAENVRALRKRAGTASSIHTRVTPSGKTHVASKFLIE